MEMEGRKQASGIGEEKLLVICGGGGGVRTFLFCLKSGEICTLGFRQLAVQICDLHHMIKYFYSILVLQRPGLSLLL